MVWKFGRKPKTTEDFPHASPEALDALDIGLKKLHQDKYLYWHASPLRLLSVFDDLKYDRSDLDMLSFSMRKHVATALKPFGCVQKNGHVILQSDTGIRFIMPKFVALGASPFAATRYHQRNENDYWIFTPTQAACFLIDHLPFDEALGNIEALLHRQPINLYRIEIFLERKASHHSYRKALSHLVMLQKKAVITEPLSEMRPL